MARAKQAADERAVRTKSSVAHAGKDCAWCRGMLEGAVIATCNGCQTEHHATCWDERGGCSRIGECRNAATVEQARVNRSLSLGMPVVTRKQESRARARRQAGTMAGDAADGTAEAAPGAFRAALLGLVGMATLAAHPMLVGANAHDARTIRYVIGGVVLVTAPLALLDAFRARRALASDDRLGGGTMAIAGIVLALVALGWGVVAVKPLL